MEKRAAEVLNRAYYGVLPNFPKVTSKRYFRRRILPETQNTSKEFLLLKYIIPDV